MAVSVSGVSGTVSTGSTLTISGSGFGAKSVAKPWLWADFNDGTGNPSSLGTATAWDDAGLLAVQTGTVYSGSYAAGSSSGWRTNSQGSFLQTNWGLGYGDKFYINLKHASTQTPYYGATNTQNTKTSIRMWAGSVGGTPSMIIGGSQAEGGPPPDTIVVSELTLPYVTGVNRFFLLGAVTQPTSAWRTETLRGQHNSANDANDGVLSLFIDGVDYGTSTGVEWDNAAAPGEMNILRIQQTLSNNGGEVWCSTGDAYFDNIYVDVDTWQRVEIGNANTYAGCTTLDPQIPSAWSDTEITATCNLGRFTDEQNIYLYVVDSLNAVNASGFLLRAASTGKASAGRLYTPNRRRR